MTKSGLIEAVAQRTPHISKKDTEIVVNTIFDSMASALKEGERIEIRGFGVLGVKDTKPKPAARNPRTGEIVYVPARKKSYFKAGVLIKKALHKPLDDGQSVETTGAAPDGLSVSPQSPGAVDPNHSSLSPPINPTQP